MRPLPLRSACDLPAAVLGGTMVRGLVTPVVSLPILLGQSGGGESRFVAVQAVGRDWVLAVDAVEQIGEVAAESFQPLPALLQDVQAAQAVAAADRDFIMTLDLVLIARLLPPSEEVGS